MPINIMFERIHPTPSYPTGLTSEDYNAYLWDSTAKNVVTFKQQLKDNLRMIQGGLCCYCRRQLPDPMVTDLEHFIEKSAYPQFAFEITNLALSCKTCNSKKNTTFLRLQSSLKKRAFIQGKKEPSYRCPTLSPHIIPLNTIPSVATCYRWVHPHLDNYSDHLVIQKGWIFQWHTPKGLRTIRGLDLNALAQLERRALAERVLRGNLTSKILNALKETNNATLPQIISTIADYIRLRRTQLNIMQARDPSQPPAPKNTRPRL